MIEPIRCLLHSSSNGRVAVKEYSLKNGKHITEIITRLGKDNEGIREIYKDTLGYPEKVVDRVFGRLETYYPARVGVVQESDGVKTPLPEITMDMLTNSGKH